MEVTSEICYLHFWCVKTSILRGACSGGCSKWMFICVKVDVQNSCQHPPSKMVTKEQKKE